MAICTRYNDSTRSKKFVENAVGTSLCTAAKNIGLCIKSSEIKIDNIFIRQNLSHRYIYMANRHTPLSSIYGRICQFQDFSLHLINMKQQAIILSHALNPDYGEAISNTDR